MIPYLLVSDDALGVVAGAPGSSRRSSIRAATVLVRARHVISRLVQQGIVEGEDTEDLLNKEIDWHLSRGEAEDAEQVGWPSCYLLARGRDARKTTVLMLSCGRITAAASRPAILISRPGISGSPESRPYDSRLLYPSADTLHIAVALLFAGRTGDEVSEVLGHFDVGWPNKAAPVGRWPLDLGELAIGEQTSVRVALLPTEKTRVVRRVAEEAKAILPSRRVVDFVDEAAGADVILVLGIRKTDDEPDPKVFYSKDLLSIAKYALRLLAIADLLPKRMIVDGLRRSDLLADQASSAGGPSHRP